jgi:pimeloyl-ACP methyl ester carboxylesterase
MKPLGSCFLVLCLVLGAAGDARAGDRQTVRVDGGVAFDMVVVTPDLVTPGVPAPLIFLLPPGPGDLSMVDAFLENYWLEEANRRGYVLVSPAVMGRSLETAAYDVLDAAFEWIEENVSYDKDRVVLAGQSNGGLGAFHALRVHPDWFSSMIVMPGGYGGSGSLEMLTGKPILLAVGEQDAGWVQLAHSTRDLLRLADARPRLDVVPGAGHVFPYDPEDLFDWMEQFFPAD